jgi:hypothetical protein
MPKKKTKARKRGAPKRKGTRKKVAVRRSAKAKAKTKARMPVVAPERQPLAVPAPPVTTWAPEPVEESASPEQEPMESEPGSSSVGEEQQ